MPITPSKTFSQRALESYRVETARTDALTILNEIDSILESPSKWIKGTFAKTEDYRAIAPSHNRACMFCIMGAHQRATRNYEHNRIAAGIVVGVLRMAVEREFGALRAHSLSYFNDHEDTSFNDVKRVITRARNLLETKTDIRC